MALVQYEPPVPSGMPHKALRYLGLSMAVSVSVTAWILLVLTIVAVDIALLKQALPAMGIFLLAGIAAYASRQKQNPSKNGIGPWGERDN